MEHTHRTGGRRELHMARSMCWHCQSEMTGEYFCQQCVKVQPLSKELDYFTCLGLPRLLTIDEDAVEKKYYELSRTFHPDFFQNQTETEQAISLGNSALLNTAYRTLKDPISRAEYLVRLEAGSAKDIRSNPPAELFEEILELQEAREEFRALPAGDESSRKAELRKKILADRDALEQRQQEMEARLFQLFGEWDQLQSQDAQDPAVQDQRTKVLHDMREILSNRTYLRNIVDDLAETVS